MIQRVVQIPLPAQVDYLPVFQQLRQSFPDFCVHKYRSLAASDDHQHRLFPVKTAEFSSSVRVTVQKFLTDGRSRHKSLALRQTVPCFRKITADFYRIGNADPVCQTRSHIRFMNQERDFQLICCQCNRNSHKSSLGKNNIRTDLLQNLPGLMNSLQHTERIGNIFQIKISSEFSGRNTIIGNVHVLNQLFFDSVVGTDVKNLIPSFLQSRYQRDVRCYMTRCSAACKYNTLHTFSPVPDSFRADTRPPFSGFSDAANLNSVYATGLKSQVCCSYRKLLSASRRVSPLLKGTAMPGFRSTSFRKVPFREFKSRIR